MPGICPSCVRMVSDSDRCPVCGGGLMSPREWEQRKDEFIGRQQASTPPIQGPAEMRTGSPEEGGEYYGFRMGIGCLTGILTFFLVFWIAYLTYNAIA